MNQASNPLLLLAGFLGLAGVVLGALGAHAWEAVLAERGATASWNTAVLYHLVHTAALMVCGVSNATGRSGAALKRAGFFFAGGILLFSGSIYILSLGGPRFLGPVTPLGGILFMVGWGLVVTAAFRPTGNTAPNR